MERIHINRARLAGLALGLLLAVLPVLAFAQTDDGSGAIAAAVLGFYCVCAVIWLAIAVAIAFWVYNDAKKRGNPNAAIWGVVGFFLHVIGLLLYFVIGRNQGTMGGTPPAGPTGPSTTARY